MSLPGIKRNKDESLEDAISKLFADKVEFVLGEINMESQIIVSSLNIIKLSRCSKKRIRGVSQNCFTVLTSMDGAMAHFILDVMITVILL